ncbi:MAG: helix-turn-helix domain-containing protein [Alcaligenaceae bacterium]|nr:helix-turn-helix domain-containing protein [Alcaligenaceae bacterium]
MKKETASQTEARGGVQVVSRAAAIMRALSVHPGGMSLSAIAQEVNLPRSTVQRLVTALEIEGMVDAKGPNGGTRLGPTISSLLATAHADMVVFGRHRLKLLLDEVNETTSIIAAVNAQSMVLETMATDHVLRVVLNPGSQAPLHVSAGGKALLSAYDDDLIDALFSKELPSLTSHTLKRRADLVTQVQKARAEGIASARNEHTMGISSMATVVNTPMGVYAFEVTLPDVRFDERAKEIKEIMLVHKELLLSDVWHYDENRPEGALGIQSAQD